MDAILARQAARLNGTFMKSPTQKTRRSSRSSGAVETVVEHIKQNIRHGRFAPGQRLVEADLTAELGVSRGPVREAMRRLAAEGLVLIERHRGAVVRQMSRGEVMALYQLREAIEGLAARLAAGRVARGPRRRRIAQLFRRLSAAARRHDVTAYADGNESLHRTIVEIAGNPHLPELLERLRLPILRLQFRLMLDQDAVVQSHADHTRLVRALLRGDAAGAETEMRRHIRRSGALIHALPDALFRQGR
jgi:DNA-binding GntR family transcriptional regulator